MVNIVGARWHEASPLLDELLELDAEARASRLILLRAEDLELATYLEMLLAEEADVEHEKFLAASPLAERDIPSLAGQVVGAYTLDRPIGHGGMGTVWLAARSDGRFAGKAAVKFLNLALLGRGGAERFAREGSVLARFTHANIARLLDAGVMTGGQPYLVLEYVEGEPIDQYCNAHGLDTAARIRLFLELLEAVSHAHRNLVLHRDLKPSNILVTPEGRVKLLDFGVAKLQQDSDTPGAATELTQLAGRAFTPEYAAPEQVQGGDVTTATDVYALGVLFYVLLSGKHPTASAALAPVDRLRAVVETEPARLSDIAQRCATDDAARVDTAPDHLAHELRGDLDNIAAKALKKLPAERYPTVDAFADDLKRYLRHDPVSARPDSLSYRSAKFVRRNRNAVLLVALVLIALAAGLAGTIIEARRATREAEVAAEQRDFALRQLSRAEAINDLNSFVLSDAAPSGKPFTVGELLKRAEDVVERQHAASDANRADMFIAIGRQYQTQEEDAKARELLGRAYTLADKVSDRSVHARAGCELAIATSRSRDMDGAERLIRDGLAEIPDGQQFTLSRILCLWRGSEVARFTGDAKTAIARAESARSLLTDLRFPSALLEMHLWGTLGESYRVAGRYQEAVNAFQQELTRLTALGRDNTDEAATLFNNWALSLQSMGQPMKAQDLFQKAIAISRSDGSNNGVSPMLLTNAARSLAMLQHYSEAASYAEQAYDSARHAGGDLVIDQSLIVRASIYREMGDLPRAAKMLAEVEPRLRAELPAGHVAFAGLAVQLGLLAQARGDKDAAMVLMNQAVAIAEAGRQTDYLRAPLLRRSALELELHRVGDAEADAVRSVDMEKEAAAPGTASCNVGIAYLALGRALNAQGENDRARTAFTTALEELRPTLGPTHPQTLEAERLASESAGRSRN